MCRKCRKAVTIRKSNYKLLPIFLLLAGLLFASQQHERQTAQEAVVAKLNYLRENAARKRPDSKPVEFSQNEINAYFAAGSVQLPPGVQNVTYELHPQQIIGAAQIDFDKFRAGRSDNNPLLAIFSGTHQVVVDSFAEGNDGQALIRVNSVAVDGVNLPRFAIEMFVKRYIQPKHPEIGMETRFVMPARVVTATVSEQKATLLQR